MGDFPHEPPPPPPEISVPESTAEPVSEVTETVETGTDTSSTDLWQVDDDISTCIEAHEPAGETTDAFNEAAEPPSPPEITPDFNEAAELPSPPEGISAEFNDAAALEAAPSEGARGEGHAGEAPPVEAPPKPVAEFPQEGVTAEFNEAASATDSADDEDDDDKAENPAATHDRQDWNPPRPPKFTL